MSTHWSACTAGCAVTQRCMMGTRAARQWTLRSRSCTGGWMPRSHRRSGSASRPNMPKKRASGRRSNKPWSSPGRISVWQLEVSACFSAGNLALHCSSRRGYNAVPVLHADGCRQRQTSRWRTLCSRRRDGLCWPQTQRSCSRRRLRTPAMARLPCLRCCSAPGRASSRGEV